MFGKNSCRKPSEYFGRHWASSEEWNGLLWKNTEFSCGCRWLTRTSEVLA
jgi:hypothetical protein